MPPSWNRHARARAPSGCRSHRYQARQQHVTSRGRGGSSSSTRPPDTTPCRAAVRRPARARHHPSRSIVRAARPSAPRTAQRRGRPSAYGPRAPRRQLQACSAWFPSAASESHVGGAPARAPLHQAVGGSVTYYVRARARGRAGAGRTLACAPDLYVLTAGGHRGRPWSLATELAGYYSYQLYE